ncbi:hypothetical protein ACOJBO_08515 [Rhizobium beringeri]
MDLSVKTYLDHRRSIAEAVEQLDQRGQLFCIRLSPRRGQQRSDDISVGLNLISNVIEHDCLAAVRRRPGDIGQGHRGSRVGVHSSGRVSGVNMVLTAARSAGEHYRWSKTSTSVRQCQQCILFPGPVEIPAAVFHILLKNSLPYESIWKQDCERNFASFVCSQSACTNDRF